MKVRPLYLLIILLLIAFAFARIYPKVIYSAEKKAFLMGTPVRVKIKGPDASRLAKLAIEEIRRLDQLFSKFNPQSEIYQLNLGKEIQLSPDTSRILKQAKRFSKLSRGAFDITLGRSNAKIDLGAIAKGYAVESARSLLLKKGAQSGMIDMRSSISVFGPKSWKVGVQHPREKEKLIGIIELSDGQSLATSGDYERGKHIIDPRTGKPASGCQSVTLIGKDATEIDALSTAVFVLGPREGMGLIESLSGIEGLIVDVNGRILLSSGFVLLKK